MSEKFTSLTPRIAELDHSATSFILQRTLDLRHRMEFCYGTTLFDGEYIYRNIWLQMRHKIVSSLTRISFDRPQSASEVVGGAATCIIYPFPPPNHCCTNSSPGSNPIYKYWPITHPIYKYWPITWRFDEPPNAHFRLTLCLFSWAIKRGDLWDTCLTGWIGQLGSVAPGLEIHHSGCTDINSPSNNSRCNYLSRFEVLCSNDGVNQAHWWVCRFSMAFATEQIHE